MDKELKSRLDAKLLKLAGHLYGICKRKKIEIIDRDTFVLHNRKTILDYHILTGDYGGLIKNFITGKAALNEAQFEEYQRRDFIRVNGDFTTNVNDYITYSRID